MRPKSETMAHVRRGLESLTAVLLLALLGGCGSSGHKTTSSAAASAPTSSTAPGQPPGPGAAIPPNAPPALRAIAGRVLKAGDLQNLVPQGRRTLGINVSSWVAEEAQEGLPPSEVSTERQRLTRLGFVTGVRERLTTPNETGPEAISIVIRFRSPRAAMQEVQSELKGAVAHGSKPFAVPRIPGAKGFGGSSGTTTGYNVAFTVGPYYYLVGTGYPTGIPGAPSREQLIAAAQRLYARVR